ncbi:MAG: hypothetical protein ACYDA6_06580, partial [Solirubrobacteraceae bacterium]
MPKAELESHVPDGGLADASVIILAYSMERWSLTCAAVESVLDQTVPPQAIILYVDDNPELAERFRERWQDRAPGGPALTVAA